VRGSLGCRGEAWAALEKDNGFFPKISSGPSLFLPLSFEFEVRIVALMRIGMCNKMCLHELYEEYKNNKSHSVECEKHSKKCVTKCVCMNYTKNIRTINHIL
jgi:hypothetical protein